MYAPIFTQAPSGKGWSGYVSSGQGGVRSICVVGDCGAISGSSARDDSHCPHIWVRVDCSFNELLRSSAGDDDDLFGFVSSVVVVVILTGPVSDVSVSSDWSTYANLPTCALNRWRRRENVLRNAMESSATCWVSRLS